MHRHIPLTNKFRYDFDAFTFPIKIYTTLVLLQMEYYLYSIIKEKYGKHKHCNSFISATDIISRNLASRMGVRAFADFLHQL